MLRNLRQLVVIMRQDSSISGELPPAKQLLLRAGAWMVGCELWLVLQTLPVKFFIDEISADGPRLQRLLLIVGLMLLMHETGKYIRARMAIHRDAVDWSLWRIWWGYGHRCELRLSPDWHTRHSTGEKESYVGKNIAKFQDLVVNLLFDVVPVMLRVSFTVAFMFIIGWQFGLACTASLALFGVVMWHSERNLKEQRKVTHQQRKQLERFGTELTANWHTIKSIGREEDFCDKNDAMLDQFKVDEKVRYRRYMKYAMQQDSAITYSRGLVYALVAYMFVSGHTAIGTVVLATTWMERVFVNLFRLSDFQHRLNEGIEALRDLTQLMLLAPSVQQPQDPKWPSELKGGIRFENVTFCYPDAEDNAIHGITLDVEPYTTTAFIGKSGSGKTTLMKLLLREYDPTCGRVLIDGIDLRQLDYNRYRREAVSYVSQNIQLFDGTIMENIRVTMPDATDEAVIVAARLAYAEEFILEQPNGYHTMVGEDGIRLSGGQRQRIAIARALLRRPAILVMDEATSALDSLSQKRIQQTIAQLIQQRVCTIFIIAHRQSTIRDADKVAVLDAGKLVQYGTHDELSAQDGLYRRLQEGEGDDMLD